MSRCLVIAASAGREETSAIYCPLRDGKRWIFVCPSSVYVSCRTHRNPIVRDTIDGYNDGISTGGESRQLLTNRPVGRILKWPTRADCKSAGLRLRRFESFSYHHSKTPGESTVLSLLNSALFRTRQNSLIPAKRRSLWAGPGSPGPE